MGKLLQGGEVIELASDLGGGKTTFVRGLAEGLGFSGRVTSPTFTVSRVYPLPGNRQLHHFDFYRLPPADIVATELAEVAGDPAVISVIEWGDSLGGKIPKLAIKLELRVVDESTRQIIIEAHNPQGQKIVEALS